jgi:hypothetical protein
MNTLKKGIARLAAKFHRNKKLVNWRKFRSRKGAARAVFSDGLGPAGICIFGSGIRAINPTEIHPRKTAPIR